MPTIHIHLPDVDDVGALITYVLRAYADPTITIDQGDPIAAHAATRVVDTVMAYEDEQRAKQQATYDARWSEAQEARNVACPKCHADIDEPCLTPKGKYYGAFAHVDRIAASKPVPVRPDWLYPTAAQAAV